MQLQPAFVPTEVHRVTIQAGAKRARLSLLSKTPGGFHVLRKNYGLPEIKFPESNIHVPIDANGQPLDDIRTPDDKSITADLLISILRELTADPGSALHVFDGRRSPDDGLLHRLYVDVVWSCAGLPVTHAGFGALRIELSVFFPTPYPTVIEVGD